MLKIGDFARAGRVSVRMLRHYDQLGLLPPAHVDEWSGRRSYEPAQLERLDRIVTLNQLGFRLDELATWLDGDQSGPEFVARLRERRADLLGQRDEISRRLDEVTRRLRLLDPTGEPITTTEDTMTTTDFTTKALPGYHVLQGHAAVDCQPQIAAVISPMFGRIFSDLSRAGITPGPGFATYTWVDEQPGGRCEFTAGYTFDGDLAEVPEGLEVVDYPPAPDAVVGIHHGEMTTIHQSWMALDRFVGEQGWAFDGPCREVYLVADGSDQSGWVTELQQPVTKG